MSAIIGERIFPTASTSNRSVLEKTSRSLRVPPKAIAAPEKQSIQRALGEGLREEFPILQQTVNGKDLVYFDNAATSQKPEQVVRALEDYYNRYNSNVHRGVHFLSAQATRRYEEVRAALAKFINAKSDREIVFTKNASEALNLVAYSWGMTFLKPGDEVLLSVAEHHSNLVPWQLIAKKTGAILRHVPITKDTQEIDTKAYHEMLNEKTKLVSMSYVSNVLGSVLPVQEVSEAAHKFGAKVLLDASQAVPHRPVDVQATGADFLVATAHKFLGPTGIGFLWGRPEVLESMPPFMGGGEMIDTVGLQESTFAAPPSRFEPGTPPIAAAIGMGAAIDYLTELGMENIAHHEEEIGGLLHQELSKVEGIKIYGPKKDRAALCAFNVEGCHSNDLSTLMDVEGIAVRSGHMCCQPLHEALGVASSCRASLYIYNTPLEVENFVKELEAAVRFFKE